jgi:hypothetical protein
MMVLASNAATPSDSVKAASLNTSIHFMMFATMAKGTRFPRVHPSPLAPESLAKECVEQNASVNELVARYQSNPRAIELGCRSPLRKLVFLLFGW